MSILQGKRVHWVIIFMAKLTVAVFPFYAVNTGLLVPTINQAVEKYNQHKGKRQYDHVEPCPQPGTHEVFVGQLECEFHRSLFWGLIISS
jgi:hypothetical protein